MHVSYEQAEQAIAAAIVESKTLGTQMCIAVVDSGADLKAFTRMNGAWVGSIDIAVKQRGKMTRGSGKTASKTVHPGMCHDSAFCRSTLGCYLWILLLKLEGVIL